MEENQFCSGRVSVVTPVYNGELHLAKMLDSVLAQTYPDIEMILVDDGSSDGTLGVAEGYREKFAARGYGYRIVAAPHRNASAAVNGGLPYVTGEYLIWPDSDDMLKPESVAKRVEFLRTKEAAYIEKSPTRNTSASVPCPGITMPTQGSGRRKPMNSRATWTGKSCSGTSWSPGPLCAAAAIC